MIALEYLWIALGGALGSVARYWVSTMVGQRWGEAFPLGTLLVNITGSLAIGFIATWTDPEGRMMESPHFRRFLMVGICGGYTTFSSFSLQTLNLVREGQWAGAGLNALLSFACCLVAVWVGHVAAMALHR
jgi:CrcB protein